MAKQLCFYDIEVTINLFLCCVKVGKDGELKTFEISERKNDLLDMITFFLNPEYIFVGYNCMGYDTPIMNMIIDEMQELVGEDYTEVTTKAYNMSAKIIGGERDTMSRYRFLDFFKQIDLMTLLASQALRVGLKPLQVTMFYKNVQEMVVDWTKPVPLEDFDNMIFYCHNDVESTAKLGHLLKGQLELRLDIMKTIGLQGLLSKDPVGVGVEVFTNDICKQMGIQKQQLMDFKTVPPITKYSEFIEPIISFRSPVLNEVLEWYKASTVTHDDIVTTPSGYTPKGKRIVSKTVVFNNLQHTFAQGGLHSVNKPAIYEQTDKMMIIDLDVDGYYPSLVAEYGFGPKGFAGYFSKTISNYKDQRIKAKAIGKNKQGIYTPEQVKVAQIEDKTKKLSLNSMVGKLRDKYSAYLAPQANAAICVNGQLMLAMLIEDMEDAGYQCIMSNTDGATFLVPTFEYEKFKTIYKAWEAKTRLTLEETFYEKMVITGVNDYVSYKKGYNDIKDSLGWDNPEDVLEYNYAFIKSTPNNDRVSDYIKAKGAFGYYATLGKGLDSLIVSKALIDYFGKGIPIEHTIEMCPYIYDFVAFQKIGKQYDVIHNQKTIQHINRFYVCKQAPMLYKQKTVMKENKKTGKTETVKTMESVIAGKGVRLFNEYEDKPIPEYNIDYSYYIIRCRDIIRSLEPEQLSLPLFDDKK
jgi:hypothetical protein